MMSCRRIISMKSFMGFLVIGPERAKHTIDQTKFKRKIKLDCSARIGIYGPVWYNSKCEGRKREATRRYRSTCQYSGNHTHFRLGLCSAHEAVCGVNQLR
jgi:hypothetical protein